MTSLPRWRGTGFGSVETVASDDDHDSQCSDTSTGSDQSQATVISNVTSSTIRQSEHEVKISEAELGCLSSEVWKTLTWLRRRRCCLSPSRVYSGIRPGAPPTSIKELIREVKVNQGSVDLLLEKGQRFLGTFPDIKLKVDLENLAFYWRTYVKELQSLDNLQTYWLSTRRLETQTGNRHLHQTQDSSALSDLGKRPKCIPRSQKWKQCVYKYVKSVENYKSQQHPQAPVTKVNRQTHEIASQPSSSVTEEPKGKEASGSHFIPSLQVGSTIRKSTCFSHLPDLYKSRNPVTTHRLYSSMEGLRSGPRSPLSARKGEGNLRTFSPTFDKTGLKDRKIGSNPELSFIPDSPTEPKRRRMVDDIWSSNVSSQVSSRSHSPTLSINSETTLDDSYLSTPGCSPAATLKDQFKKRYSKYELTIESDLMDQCLMDYDLLEACKSTESDEENIGVNAKVSLAEFQQQYRELSEWLDQVLQVTKRTMGTLALSEKYLTQSYHEELLKQSPRHKLFNEYAKQLLQRRSGLKGEIMKCLNHVNSQWEVVEKAVSCKDIWQDKETMLKDLEADIVCLRKWLDGVEHSLSTFQKPNFTDDELHRKLLEHQVLQRDIESHSRNVNAVLKLSEHLQDEAAVERVLDHNRLYLERSANTLQQRWHSAWLLSLEAQCRLENELKTKKFTFPSPILGSKWIPDLLKFDSDFLGGNVSGSGFDDSFGLPLRQADVADSPLLDDSSFGLDRSSFGLDHSSENQSGKDSAVVSEVEGKMSSEYSDSDLDMLKHHRLKSDSRDIGYSSGTTESLGHISTESDCEDIKKLIAGAERLVTPERSSVGNKQHKEDNSCDASSEESDGGSDVYSTASDDGSKHEAMFDSVLGLDYNSDASLPQNLPAFHNTVKLRQRKCRKDRPWSAIQLTDIGDDFDISSLSRSETAIDRLSYGSEHLSANNKLGGSAATFPRAGAKRKLYESSQTSPPEGSVFDSSESETESSACSDDYETAQTDILVSDEEDGLNSTASVSEPAWDNYHQVYMSMGEDQEEQTLRWNQLEEDLEFDEIYPSPKNVSLVSAEMERRKKEGKSRPRLVTQSSRQGYDSDSDLEDLHYFLDDSASQLKITDHCLKKRRKDQFRTGIAMNSHKYAEIIATCQTNINCLQSVYNHLPAEATESQLENLKDMLYQWEKLHAFACERQQQSQALSNMCKSMSNVRTGLQSCEVEGTPQRFSSVTQVEQSLKLAKKNHVVLQSVQQTIRDLYKTGQGFQQDHPSINLDVFVEQLKQADLVSSLKLERVNQDLPDIQQIHNLWSEYVLLRGQLNGLLTDGFTEENLDLQDPNGPLYKVDQMISRLQALRGQLSPFIDEVTKVEMTMSMAEIHEQLCKAQKHCRQLEQLAVFGNSQETMEQTDIKTTLAANPACIPSSSTSLSSSSLSSSSSSSASWLKSGYVRAAAVFMMMGVAYMVDPDLVKRIGDFSVNVTPELRYVNGPPPV
ncbi:uncharacterized protein LOC110467090 isoform X2 [Mizuhopecten yessoensis]|uniref:uncharacterized protein LOC110467090 isoform X2 n=1 Tax=Mizuhopecten yessoensis TaxID=6573 RepID=UPI000B4592A3|nr:uncharacterized protein LOC110467090 isoform X2 [Mizuhopecten yessoensis]